ncbi:MAG TPA: LysM peptidoglycan-binding domain-containing protein [Anaerolineae bacterium]|nr:LysM peptidoglycan-binding domain-containing protein [Anaerolineae bacterium]
MFRSIWFWVISIGIALLFFLGRDQIASYLDKIPLQTTPRTTNTRALAATPGRARSTAPGTRAGSTRQPTVILTTRTAPAPKATPPAAGIKPTIKPAPTASQYTIYVVKKGDTLYRIAKRYKTTVKALQRINGIADPSKLAIGQELKVPRPPSPVRPSAPTPKPGTTTYKVRPGDTLSSIARKFNTSVGTLQKLNRFSNPNKLPVGAVILVPATTATQRPVATKRPASTPAPRPAPQEAEQEVRIMPVLTGSPPATKARQGESLAAPSPTPTPLPTLPSVCEGRQEAVFVWGVSFCVPPGWTLQEYARPYRTALLSKDEPTGDRSIYAVSRLDGSPNAPLSWTMRQAKSALAQEIPALIPGGLVEPKSWTSATEFEIAQVKGQASEAMTTYAKTGNRAHVRVIVFHAANQRWRIVIVAPETLWQGYDVTVFPYIARTLEVF